MKGALYKEFELYSISDREPFKHGDMTKSAFQEPSICCGIQVVRCMISIRFGLIDSNPKQHYFIKPVQSRDSLVSLSFFLYCRCHVQPQSNVWDGSIHVPDSQVKQGQSKRGPSVPTNCLSKKIPRNCHMTLLPTLPLASTQSHGHTQLQGKLGSEKMKMEDNWQLLLLRNKTLETREINRKTTTVLECIKAVSVRMESEGQI